MDKILAAEVQKLGHRTMEEVVAGAGPNPDPEGGKRADRYP